jgi:hypothetical protein
MYSRGLSGYRNFSGSACRVYCQRSAVMLNSLLFNNECKNTSPGLNPYLGFKAGAECPLMSSEDCTAPTHSLHGARRTIPCSVLIFVLWTFWCFNCTCKCVTVFLPPYYATYHFEGVMLATADGTSDMPDLLTSATYALVQVNLVLQINKKNHVYFLSMAVQ